MDYSLRELECFSAVAEQLSFTRAAARLHLAQPPLSRHIRTLEEKLGARLFDRKARKVSLTAAGNRFQEETRGLLAQLERAGEAARRVAGGELSRLRVGFVSAVLTSELVDIFRSFRAKFPSVQILLHDLPPAEQLRLIGNGGLDGGFVGLQPGDATEGIRFTPWRTERLAAFLPAGHALAGRKKIALREISQEPFVAVASHAAPAFSAFVHEQCRGAGFRPRILLESPRAQAVAVMVAAGSGVALLPETLTRVTGDSVAVVGLKEAPRLTHVFAHPAGRAPAPLRDFMAMMR